MAELVIISNRLPVSVRKKGTHIEVYPSAGGLATGLSGYTKRSGTKWIGWPGLPSDHLTEADRQQITKQLEALHCYPVFLTKKQVDQYYNGYSNSVLWPLFHDLPVVDGDTDTNWQAYQKVNHLFAAAALNLSEPASTIWVHDYQLMLVPQYIRAERPEDNIGFFLHIPFPEAKRFRTCKHAAALTAGTLGADLVGVHTSSYANHFLQSCRELDFGTTTNDQVLMPARTVRIANFPMGIDYQKFARAAQLHQVQVERRNLERRYRGQQVILTVDRLDPAKGLLERLKAYEILLEHTPGLYSKVTMVMLVIPSREELVTYKQLRSRLERLVARINEAYGTEQWQPVEYMYQTLPFEELAALYQRADVAFIAPLKDGMNLVAKEYLASQQHRDGVLVLSKTAGAAEELKQAIRVDPTKPSTLVSGLQRALTLPKVELRKRSGTMKRHLKHFTVERWADNFMRELQRPHGITPARTRTLDATYQQKLVDSYRAAAHRLLLFDYDGVLTSIVRNPAKAKPTNELLGLLQRLGSNPANDVVLISGRSKKDMSNWFGKLPISLAAEHGALFRRKGGHNWHKMTAAEPNWRRPVTVLLRRFVDLTPGAAMEQKDWAVAWHYRTVHPYFAQKYLVMLRRALKPLAQEYGLQVLEGKKVLEVRPIDVNKGRAAQEWLLHDYDFVLAIGDDITDEDMFRAVPPGSYSIKVGRGATMARFRLHDVLEVLRLVELF